MEMLLSVCFASIACEPPAKHPGKKEGSFTGASTEETVTESVPPSSFSV